MRGKLTKRQARELRRAVKDHCFHGNLTRWSIYKKLFLRGYVVGVKETVFAENGKVFTWHWRNELTSKGRKALGMKP